MATDKRTYPNDYFVWYNDDDRVAILTQDTTATSGERTREKYDTFQGSGSSGSISAFADYGSGRVKATDTDHGLSTNDSITISGATTSAHNGTKTVTKIDKDNFYYTATFGEDSTATWSATNVLSGIRITFHSMYEQKVKKHRGRRSGVRFLATPRL